MLIKKYWQKLPTKILTTLKAIPKMVLFGWYFTLTSMQDDNLFLINCILQAFSSVKFQENGSGTIKSSSYNKDDIGQVTLDDYNPIDPVPSSSKASINPGPIEHSH